MGEISVDGGYGSFCSRDARLYTIYMLEYIYIYIYIYILNVLNIQFLNLSLIITAGEDVKT